MATEQYSGINGMFGPSPEEVQQMRQTEIAQQARRDINLTPSQQAAVGYREVGGMLGDAIGGAMGYENPQVARAKKIQELIKDVDTTSSTSLLEAARKLNAAGLYREAQMAANKGNELLKQEQVEAHAVAKDKVAERKQAASEGQDYELKKMQIEAAIRQRDESIANKATSDSDRVAAIRERNQLMGMIKAANSAPLAPVDKETIDYYAAQSLAGDNSWQVGLARGKVGQQLIGAVKDRIPQMAKEQNITPIDAIATKQELATKGAALKDFTSGPSAKSVRSFNVAIDHLDTLGELAIALNNNDTRALNAIGNTVARWSGDAAPTNFDAAKQTVAAEVEKAIIGGQTAFGDRKEAMAKISSIGSPQQLAEYISTMKSLMGGQIKGLAHQYKTSTGRDDFHTRLEPKALQVYNSSNAPQSAAKGGTLTPAEQAELAALKARFKK